MNMSIEGETQETEFVLDYNVRTNESLLVVDNALTRNLKQHQIEGVRFMWDSCYEKIDMIAQGHKGGGCLLSHCMGLGKTLQVITLVHTLLANCEKTKVKRVLILVPINVQANWREEFKKWTKYCKKKIRVYELPFKNTEKNVSKARSLELERWFDYGGAFIVGYSMFVRLVMGVGVKDERYLEKFHRYLLNPGPDLVVCDEGHILKNDKSKIASTVCQVNTLRRIALTGTPLQNNLLEYHCMVSFVKPNLLGTLKEFKNRFVNPINNGQHRDSTEADVRYMKRRAHILHKSLDGFVQRKDYDVIRSLLPPKSEYVLNIRLSGKQIELYRNYLVKIRCIENESTSIKLADAQLFNDFHTILRICTHPWLLKMNENRRPANRSDDKSDFDEINEEEFDFSVFPTYANTPKAKQ